MSDPVDVESSVRSALNCNKPVVALESCVVTHGLPAGDNVRTACELEAIIREAGAVPATIGVLGGRIKVGMTEDEIKDLAESESVKLAARDLPYAVARKLNGGTTVSATARLAAAAGITVVCTGGIGGAHYGSAETGDISADLWELTRSPVAIVCAGPKAIVDAAKTAEWLETYSVPVYGYQTDDMPAFYSGATGISIPRVDNPHDFAEVVRVSRSEFGVRCALVLAVPVDKKSAVDVNNAVREALKEAADRGVGGKDATPYLLERVSALTKGASVQANINLLKKNARVAADVACAMFEQENRRVGFGA